VKVEYVFIADSALVSPDGKLWVLGGEVARLGQSALPVTQNSLTLVFKLVWEASDADPQQLSISFVDPSGKPMMAPYLQTVSKKTASVGADGEINMPICFNLYMSRFVVSGKYSYHILVNGVELARRSLIV
jgi:hypothetical protein